MGHELFLAMPSLSAHMESLSMHMPLYYRTNGSLKVQGRLMSYDGICASCFSEDMLARVSGSLHCLYLIFCLLPRTRRDFMQKGKVTGTHTSWDTGPRSSISHCTTTLKCQARWSKSHCAANLIVSRDPFDRSFSFR
jgi:hypothetical protein